MIGRRGFFGALAALVALPSVLLRSRASAHDQGGSYSYKVRYVDAKGETVPSMPKVEGVVARKLYRSNGDGSYRLIAAIKDNSVTHIDI